MKKTILILFLIFTVNSFSQQSEEYTKFIEEIKHNSKSDKNNKTVFNLLNDFYEQVLQSDNGELNQNTLRTIQELYADHDAKNLQILSMFLAYQEHISESFGAGSEPDTTFQLNLLNDLESELDKVYGNVPVIVKIYKAEALNSAGQNQEYGELLRQSLIEFPNSVPLKVYSYLDTKDEKLKIDLIKNHSNHWMVQQFQIK